MSLLSRELVFIILQFLDEEKFKESVHRLEKESGFFFNTKYFDEKVLAGEWDEVEKYLSGFTKLDDNRYSMKIFFEIRKQKYLEALDKQDKAKAVEILEQDLRVFSTFNEELYKEITQLLTLHNFRENEQLSKYGDTKTARAIMLGELKKLIEANPLFRDKLTLPTLRSSRLRTLINQSLNWQHQLCKNPRPNPDIKTLFIDHTCAVPNGPMAPSPVNQQPVTPLTKPTSCSWLGAHDPFPPGAANAGPLASWMVPASGASTVQAAVVTPASIPLTQNQVSVLKRPPATPGVVDYQNPDHELMKRLRLAPSVEEVTYPAPRQHALLSLEHLPLKTALALHQGSAVTSMEFHPMKNTLLLVGSSTGEITLWELAGREKLVSRPFRIWDMANCSPPLQAFIANETPMSVTRVAWSPDGNFIGVAYTKHLIHLYAFSGPNELSQHAEVDAHVGAVNDLGFANPNRQLRVVTCGDDKLIKVWDISGTKHFTFEGHEAPVYSICPHQKENAQFIFSTAIDGKIKGWIFYDNVSSRFEYDAPGKWCTTMLYSADGTRLFSCGASKDGQTFLVEWNQSEREIKRNYLGFQKMLVGMVHFDTSKNHFLAVGEDRQIKFWDMDNSNVLTSTDAEGGLAALPRLRFNREGNLLAVSTADNGFKILANQAGFRSLSAVETSALENMRTPADSSLLTAVPVTPVPPPVAPVSCKVEPVSCKVEPVICKVERGSPVRLSPMLNGVDPPKPRIDEFEDKPEPWQVAEILDPAQCRQATLPDITDISTKVVRLLYTNSGDGILVLGFNGIQRLYKWVRNEQNPSGKATAAAAPQHWQPNSGLLMTNHVSGVNREEANLCIALSKNDSYVMSAAGGKVSLFNMMTFKVMATFMPTPPASTFLAFHPQDNNVIAIGVEDSTIHIYNVRVEELKTKLRGHQKRITGLAFSPHLSMLVSSGADAQICFWSIVTWEKRKSVAIQMPAGNAASGDTRVQFHVDQIRVLAVHETQLAILMLTGWNVSDSGFLNTRCLLLYLQQYTLRLRCRISPSAYLPQGNQGLSPLVVAAHPQEPNQFAVGLNDGSVKVIETD
ncbi:Topless-related protein 3 [Raphanus sativus]|nr:Topless-related protein 3 [Raphanus sativus]